MQNLHQTERNLKKSLKEIVSGFIVHPILVLKSTADQREGSPIQP